MKDLLTSTLYASLVAQWSTLALNVYSLTEVLPLKDLVLQTVLWIETVVQVIELVFYSWYAYHFKTVAEATFYRYHDWAVTTPLMLLSTMIYYEYENKPEEVVTLESFWEDHWKDVLIVFGFNAIMLLFGYLYERNGIDLMTSQGVGFAGLVGSFYVIWDRFASKSPKNYPLFWFMASVWSLYGVAAFASPALKNASYNILDVVAKNFYGLFLSYIIHQKASNHAARSSAGVAYSSKNAVA
jgi:hypothetical protein